MDRNGKIEWDKTFGWDGTPYFGYITDVFQTSSGEYLVIRNKYNYRSKLFKLDRNGKEVWNTTLKFYDLKFCEEVADGYLLIGKQTILSSPKENGEPVVYINPQYKINLLKIDKNGSIVWNATCLSLWGTHLKNITTGGVFEKYEKVYSFEVAIDDSGYIFIAKRKTYYSDINEGRYRSPLWIIKTDVNYNEKWNLTLNDTPVESVQQTLDGGYILIGLKPDGGFIHGKPEFESTTDIWLMKLGKYGKNLPPIVTIIDPPKGAVLRGNITLRGTASDSDGVIQKVEIKVDSGSWITANGTTSWSYNWDTTTVTNGLHTIYVRSYDGEKYSLVESVTVVVDNGEKIPSFAFLLTLTILVAMAFVWRRYKFAR